MNQAAQFCCYLDGQPDHLTPTHQLARYWVEDKAGHPLFLNETCRFANCSILPDELSHISNLTDGFAAAEDIAWVHNSITRSWQPFWIGSRVKAALAETQPGKLPFIAEEYRSCLAMAGVLTSPERESFQNRAASAMWSRAADQVRRRGYAPVAGLIHPFHISALRRYFRMLVRTGKLTLGDSQSSRRYYAHNESVCRFFHSQLIGPVSTIVGQPVKPSYVYFASYQEGASLTKHIDREQCQFSITLCLDYSPEPRRQTAWPLQVHTAEGVTTVYQSIGDGLVYLGCELPHSRGILPSGHTSTSIFFHYVSEGFDGPLN